ncbi:RPA family protein [Methanocella sp. MCL-LM]|uniref:RPA family protein n=1 Tax=Methanocella sp. MCL-LM TaxID=3412035 RepID=UPI003C71C78F
MPREVAKRLFAKEFQASNLTYKDGEDQFAPTYLLTPTGAKCNRVFIVGTLTEKTNIGSDSEFWKGRVSDPTGAFVIYASQYQPEAAQALSEIEVPSFVAVIGKPNSFKGQDGTLIFSVRPEIIVPVDGDTRDMWVKDTIYNTADRLVAMKAGTDADAIKAKEHYQTDVEEYKTMLLNAARSLKQMEVVVTSAK